MGWARLLPTGREVVFQSTAGGILNVHRSRLDGGGERALSDDAEGVGWPVPSPDGRTLAVEMFRGNDTQLGLLPADGGVARALTRCPASTGCTTGPGTAGAPSTPPAATGSGTSTGWTSRPARSAGSPTTARVREAVRTPAWAPSGDRVATSASRRRAPSGWSS
jgi:Tol biopolymer transport system component